MEKTASLSRRSRLSARKGSDLMLLNRWRLIEVARLDPFDGGRM